MSIPLGMPSYFKKYILLFLLWQCGTMALAQEHKNSLGLYQVLTDQNVVLTDNNYLKFDSALSHFTRIEYLRSLSN